MRYLVTGGLPIRASGVLTDHEIVQSERRHRAQQLDLNKRNGEPRWPVGGDRSIGGYLFISNVLGAEADGSLHANKRKNLDEVILHDVTDDAVAIEVASASLCANVLLLGRTKSKNAR